MPVLLYVRNDLLQIRESGEGDCSENVLDVVFSYFRCTQPMLFAGTKHDKRVSIISIQYV